LNIRQGQSITKIQQNIQLIKASTYGKELQEAAV
jgi:hypothetical protein